MGVKRRCSYDGLRWTDEALCDAIYSVVCPLWEGRRKEVLGVMVGNEDGVVTRVVPVPDAYIDHAGPKTIAFTIEGISEFLQNFVKPHGRYMGTYHSHLILCEAKPRDYESLCVPSSLDMDNAVSLKKVATSLCVVGPEVRETIFAVNAYPYAVVPKVWLGDRVPLRPKELPRDLHCECDLEVYHERVHSVTAGLSLESTCAHRLRIFELTCPQSISKPVRLFLAMRDAWTLAFAVAMTETKVE